MKRGIVWLLRHPDASNSPQQKGLDLAVGMQFPVCGVDVLVDSDVGSYEDGFF